VSFDGVLGQEHIIKRFESAIKRGRLAHGFIFAGPRGSGKTTLALALARRLLCDKKNKPGCDCSQCAKLVMDENGIVSHGDVHILAPEVQTIRVELIRKELLDRVPLRPVEGKYKFFIIQEAERMAPAASNAFLKTLEEPPTNTIIILESRRPELFLDTIHSRCQTVRLAPLDEETFFSELRSREEAVNTESARFLWRFTGGALGEALRLTAEEWLTKGDEFIGLLDPENESDPFEFAETYAHKTKRSTLEEQRRYISILLDFTIERLRLRLRDLCKSKDTQAEADVEEVEDALSRLFHAKELIRSNVKVESALERLARRFPAHVGRK
jgi:DNA polymerase-3 subunit delta'